MNLEINSNAPVVQTKEILIKAEPQLVWDVLTHIQKWPDWNSNIKDSVPEGPLSVGSTFSWKNSGSKIVSGIHTFHQNSKLGWTGKTFGGAKAIHNWYLSSLDTGTKVLTEESIEGWLVNLIKKKMNQILEDDMSSWLEMLKKEYEE